MARQPKLSITLGPSPTNLPPHGFHHHWETSPPNLGFLSSIVICEMRNPTLLERMLENAVKFLWKGRATESL